MKQLLSIILIITTLSSCRLVMPKSKRAVEPTNHYVIKNNVQDCGKGYIKCTEGHCHPIPAKKPIKPRINQFH